MKLDIMESVKEQLAVLVPYLEQAAKDIEAGKEPDPLPVSNKTLVLGQRILVGWKPYIVKGALTAEGVMRYYQSLKGG